MTDRMRILAFEDLLNWILREMESQCSIFGIPEELFFLPRDGDPYASKLFGHHLATPIGPAAGPHTQLAQNIISSWLCGGRFIELKTVQVMDDLAIPRPCIDMADEGYNVEWSQELRLHESLSEYVKAWALVHVLRHLLGMERSAFGTIFAMSIGYNLEGILSPPMQRFMDRLANADSEIEAIREELQTQYPRFADIEIPAQIVDNVTLSTMHGCPPDEIEKIALYLIEERGLHTTVKLNPTLLGRETVLRILHDDLGYDQIRIPASVFDQDLQYERAIRLIRSLKTAASRRGVTFGVKLSNTLAMANHREVLPGKEMYMSGRALYPITMNLFHQLIEEFDGELNVSYSAGADALNLPDILAAGARPVTVASDLLKPGGYGRFSQYIEHLGAQMERQGACSLEDLTTDRRSTLTRTARASLADPRYGTSYHPHGLPTVTSPLEAFDCVEAPCVARCAVCQDVPDYAHWLARGDADRALDAILRRNPLPGVTGYVCTHLCQTRCTRNAYDEPVAIRRLKRFAAENGSVSVASTPSASRDVAVVGSGPSGLAAAFFLATNGIRVTVFEARDQAGGMLAIAPSFRLPQSIVQADVERIERLGVRIERNRPIHAPPEQLLEEGFDAVYIACGFSRDAVPPIEGAGVDGVYGALEFLDRVAHGDAPKLGSQVLVIGGGNTAMDAARTACRLTGHPSTVVYRRSRPEMPAEKEEIDDLLLEGNHLLELVSPIRVTTAGGSIAGLDCVRTELGECGEDGRRRPVPIAGSDVHLPATAILLATGQQASLPFLDRSRIVVDEGKRIQVDQATGRTTAERVYAGGDIVRGPAIIIEACADGRRAAEAICAQLGVPFATASVPDRSTSDEDVRRLKVARAHRSLQHRPDVLPIAARSGFEIVEGTLSASAVREEAKRCLQCQILCDRCVEVCPNRANIAIRVSTVDALAPIVACQNGTLTTVGEERIAIVQQRQILHIDDLCNECGNCATFCTHAGGRPYADKPRLFLDRTTYDAESDNALFVEGQSLLQRKNGQNLRLDRTPSGFTYSDPGIQAQLSLDYAIETLDLRTPFTGSVSLRPAIEMAILLDGIARTASYLPIAIGPEEGAR